VSVDAVRGVAIHLPISIPTGGADANRAYAIGMARAFGGALLFSLPILMTMETWSLGFSMDRLRLALLMVSLLPLLVGLAYYSGFEDTMHLRDAVLDAFAAIAVTTVMAAIFLFLTIYGALEIPLGEWGAFAVLAGLFIVLGAFMWGKRSKDY